MTELDDNNFQSEVLESAEPTLVYFWAPWCGPCKMVGPQLEKIHEEDTAKFKFTKANLEVTEKTSKDLKILATPTLLMYKNGEEVARKSGAMMRGQLVQFIDSNI